MTKNKATIAETLFELACAGDTEALAELYKNSAF